LSLIKDLHARLNITVFLITHQMPVIREICQQVVVLEKGNVAEYGTVSAVFSEPKTQATKDLIHV
jgi:D-methionine transport system ATP-binding protein